MTSTNHVNAALASAIAEAETTHTIVAALAKHPREVQVRLLASILVPMSGSESSARPAATVSAPRNVPAVAHVSADAVEPPRKRGAFASNPDSFTSKLLAALRTKPRNTIAELATLVYGDAEETSRNKIRSLLQLLKKRNLARAYEPGVWEATANR